MFTRFRRLDAKFVYIYVRETLTNSICLCVCSFSPKKSLQQKGDFTFTFTLSLSPTTGSFANIPFSPCLSRSALRAALKSSLKRALVFFVKREHKKQNKNGEQHTGEENHPSAISGEEDEQNASYESSSQYSDDEYEEYDKEKEEGGKRGPVTSGRNREESETSVD